MTQAVSLIGLGAMGSALARVLLEQGFAVTVWNRSADKAAAWVAAGATLAATPAECIAASPLTLICVSRYEHAQAVLESAAEEVAGRHLVQLSTGGPSEARAASDWAHAHGASYLDGAILAFPPQMGSDAASIICSGDAAGWAVAEPVLRALAPHLDYLGAAPGAAAAQDCAVAAYFAGGLVGALHGARICLAEGLPVDAYGQLMERLSPLLGGDIRLMSERIAAQRFADPGASLATWTAALQRLVRHAQDSGIDTAFPRHVAGLFQEGCDAGLGAEEVAALIKLPGSRG